VGYGERCRPQCSYLSSVTRCLGYQKVVLIFCDFYATFTNCSGGMVVPTFVTPSSPFWINSKYLPRNCPLVTRIVPTGHHSGTSRYWRMGQAHAPVPYQCSPRTRQDTFAADCYLPNHTANRMHGPLKSTKTKHAVNCDDDYRHLILITSRGILFHASQDSPATWRTYLRNSPVH
jgi:hypothetical protein